MEDVAEVTLQDAGALPTAVFSGLEILYGSSKIHGQRNSPQLAVFECSYLLQHLITKKLKFPDSNDTILQPDYTEFQPGLKFQPGRFRKC